MDRAYAVDLGGNIYRIAFPTATPSDWTLTKIASLGTDATQKMFYAPAVTVNGTSIAIQVGTGDREKPLGTNSANRFYTVLDKGQTTAVDRTNLTQMTVDGLSTIPADSYGCYFNLPNAGEKVVNAVTYTSGFSFFGTNYPTPPSPTSCASNLGVASIYAIPAFCGAVTVNEVEGGGFPPTAVIGTVLIPRTDGTNCETNPENCSQVPVGIGITPPDCNNNPSTVSSAIGATNIYACAPRHRLRRDWSITNPR
jgi:type IV pilus assembly protein PilY1